MTTLQEVLAGDGCGVFRFEGDSASALARMAGRTPGHVRIEAPPGKRALLDTLAVTLRFPDHFGANWDALYDCLTDLERVKAPGLIIEIRGLTRFSREAPRELSSAIETFKDAAEFWRERKGRLLVLLGDAGRVAANLPALEA
jgi:RNAse (barnase) inhibitor barstar